MTRPAPDDLPDDPRESLIPRKSAPIPGVASTHTMQPSVVSRWLVSGSVQATPPPAPEEKPLDHPPMYRLLRIAGRGGFGEVWEAIQESLGRIVAVKRVRRDIVEEGSEGPSSPQSLTHSFKQEALTTARLDHPNIVPVYDLGVDTNGMPLLAMKFVRGRPWNELLDEQRYIAIEERLARNLPILIDVAHAVAFAHARGIMHRDLKPSQVIVGDYGEVQLADWGLAIAFREGAGEVEGAAVGLPNPAPSKETATNPAGTVAYMAPEQTEDSASGLGPWTDIWLLGGMLYYMLAGVAPHYGETALQTWYNAVRATVMPPHERNPGGGIPDELSRICMKALAPDPANRHRNVEEFVEALVGYQSGASRRSESAELARKAEQLLASAAGDYEMLTECDNLLRRALTLWPANEQARGLHERLVRDHITAARAQGDLRLARVMAQRIEDAAARTASIQEIDGQLAEAHRHSRQRRQLIAATFLLLFVGIIAISGAFVFMSRAKDSAHRAEQQQQLAEEHKRLAALFRDIDQLRTSESALAAKIERLIPLPERIEEQSSDAVDVESINDLLEQKEELSALRANIKRRERDLAPDVGGLLEPEPYALVIGEASLALHGARSTAQLLAAFQQFSEARDERPELPEPLAGMGIAAARAGYPTSATTFLAESTRLMRERDGESHPRYATALLLEGEANRMLNEESKDFADYFRRSQAVLEPQWEDLSIRLAERWFLLGEYERAAIYTSTTLTLMGQSSAANSRAWHARLVWGTVLSNLGRVEEARVVLEDAVQQAIEEFGDSSPQAWDTRSELSAIYSMLGRISDAEKIDKAYYDYVRSLKGPADPATAMALSNLATNVVKQGRFEEGEKFFREAVDIRLHCLGPGHPHTARSYTNLGTTLSEIRRFPEAEECLRRALSIYRSTLGPKHPETARCMDMLSTVLGRTGNGEEAEAMQREALEIRLALFGENHPLTALSYNNLSNLLFSRGKIEEGTAMLEKTLVVTLAAHGEHHPSTALAYNNVATNRWMAHRNEEALEAALKATSIYEESYGPNHHDTANALFQLASIYNSLGRFAEAEKANVKSLSTRLTMLDVGDPKLPAGWYGFASSLDAQHMPVEAWLAYLEANRTSIAAGELTRITRMKALRSLHFVCAEGMQTKQDWAVESFPVIAATFEGLIRERKSVTAGMMRQEGCDTAEQLTSCTLALANPRRDLAERLVLRRAAFEHLVAPADKEFSYSPELLRDAGILGMGDRLDSIAPPPESLAQALKKMAPAADAWAYVDGVAPPVDWLAEFHGPADIESIPSARDYSQRAATLLQQRLAFWNAQSPSNP